MKRAWWVTAVFAAAAAVGACDNSPTAPPLFTTESFTGTVGQQGVSYHNFITGDVSPVVLRVTSLTPTIGPDVVRMVGVSSSPAGGLPSLNLRRNLEWAEKETVRRALESAGGVKKDAAQAMGISQRALSYYLAKYRVE